MIKATDLFSLAQMREHCRIEDEVSDSLIEIFADGALAYCLKFCDEPVWATASDVPANVKAAVLLFMQDLESNRGAQSEAAIYKNEGAHNLLLISRNFYGAALPEA